MRSKDSISDGENRIIKYNEAAALQLGIAKYITAASVMHFPSELYYTKGKREKNYLNIMIWLCSELTYGLEACLTMFSNDTKRCYVKCDPQSTTRNCNFQSVYM